MELTEKELKELSKVSLDLQLKIKEWARLFEIVKRSHSFSTYMTIYKQRKSWQDEIDREPFTIRSQEEGEDARAQSETAMKIIKLLPDLDSDLEKLYIKMTTDEKTEVERVKAGEAENILALHLKKVNGEKA
jgi:hypothetical protein